MSYRGRGRGDNFRGGFRGGGFRGDRGGGFRGNRGGGFVADRGRGFRGGFRGGRGGSRDGDSDFNPTKVHITNLPENVTGEQLEDLFKQYGKVVECSIIRDFAFVHFKNAEEASNAVKELHGSEFLGTNIEVKHSRSKLRQKPFIDLGDCFRCGGRGHHASQCPSEFNENQGGGFAPRFRPYGRGGFSQRGRFGGGDFSSHGFQDPYGDPFMDPLGALGLGGRLGGYGRGLGAFEPLMDPLLVAREAAYLRRLEAIAARADPYGRPPPEFYKYPAGRGRGALGAAAAVEAASISMQLDGKSAHRNAESVSSRPADDPYFASDDYSF